MAFAFSVEDVKNFINSIDTRASVVDEEIHSIESRVDAFNASIAEKCEPVRRVIAEEERRLPVLRREFEEAKKKLEEAQAKLKSCPLVIWLPKYDIHGNPDGQMPFSNPELDDLAEEVEKCQKAVNRAWYELQHCEERIETGNQILDDCSKLIIQVDMDELLYVKKQMCNKIYDVVNKAKDIIPYGKDVLSFSFHYDSNSKKYNLRIK